jgi:hypothetical protein
MSGYDERHRTIIPRAGTYDYFLRRESGSEGIVDASFYYPGCYQDTSSYRTTGSDLIAPRTRSEYLAFLEDSGYKVGDVDTGHEFVTQKDKIILSHMNSTVKTTLGGLPPTHYVYYKGPIDADAATKYRGEFMDIPDWDPTLFGTQAINRTIPTKPVGHLATFLGEFAQAGLPKITGESMLSIRDRTDVLRKVGDEYLNHVFGWLPLISDLKDMLYSVQNSYKLIEQLNRDSGKYVRRSYAFPAIKTSEFFGDFPSQVQHLGYSSNTSWLYSGTFPSDREQAAQATVNVTETSSQRIYFNGAYTYYLPLGDSLLDKLYRYSQYAEKLLGLRLTPDVLWELAPWSWLVDWFSNIGEIISNATLFSSDNLVLRYGYLTRISETKRMYALSGPHFRDGPSGPFFSQYIRFRMERVKATPFGFGVDLGTLTPQQWAILAALFMTKGNANVVRGR